jgi:hypothetical protein
VALIEEARPVGIRVLHNLDAPHTVLAASLPPNVVDDAADPLAGDPGEPDGLYLPVHVRALLLPASPSLTPAERTVLENRGREAVRAFVKEAGIGETLVYNRLVAALMSLDGVEDVVVELYPVPRPGGVPGVRRRNLVPGDALRPRLDDADLEVEVAGEIVAFDVDVAVELTELGRLGEATATLEAARLEIAAHLQERISTLQTVALPAKVEDRPTALLGTAAITENYRVTTLGYTVEYLEAGLRLKGPNPPVTLTELERPWIRSVRMAPLAVA